MGTCGAWGVRSSRKLADGDSVDTNALGKD